MVVGTVSGVALGLSALGIDYRIHAVACISGVRERVLHSKMKKIAHRGQLDDFVQDATQRTTLSRSYLGKHYGEVEDTGMAFREEVMEEIGFRFDSNYSTRCLLAAVDRINHAPVDGTYVAWITGS